MDGLREEVAGKQKLFEEMKSSPRQARGRDALFELVNRSLCLTGITFSRRLMLKRLSLRRGLVSWIKRMLSYINGLLL